jgi:hypothetical protein
MKVKVVTKHIGEGQFPIFDKGTTVDLKEECSHFLHWYACNIGGCKTYVPDIFVRDGMLTRSYNPTELVQEQDDVLEVQEIVYGWLIATNENGVTGWIPAESVVSVRDCAGR